MIKVIQILIVIITAGLILTGCASGPPPESDGGERGVDNFRDASWGMTPAQVEETESGELLSGAGAPDTIAYSDRLMEKIPVEIEYHFKDGRLVRGTYIFRNDLSPAEYSMFLYILARKYGNPVNTGKTKEMAEITWLAGPTEIDLLARGENLNAYRPGKGEDNSAVRIDSIHINYYDRSWFKKSAEKIARAEKEDKEAEETYHRYVGSWVELYPDYYAYDEAF